MKKLMRPIVLTPSPSPIVVVLGGIVATIVLTSWLFAGPAFGVRLVDVPRAFGGVVTSNPRLALAVGFIVLFVGGSLVFSLSILMVWSLMPGSETGVGGAFVKGVLWGVLVWLITGAALGAAGAVNRTDRAALPGLYALNTGMGGAAWLLIGCLAYGIALTLVAAVEHGITALDTLGWPGYYHAATGPTWVGEHRSLDVPQPAEREHP